MTIWQKKLEAYECESSHEMELVNEILTNLLQCCTNRTLTEPFNAAPPEELVLEQLIVTKTLYMIQNMYMMLFFFFVAKISGNPQNTNKATAMKARIPELFEISPDNGDFLMEQPVPRSGVFCYLAVINKEPSKK